jgi:catechol 2,3-dioxygenase-like lactoylglutathione lyase family enzyme
LAGRHCGWSTGIGIVKSGAIEREGWPMSLIIGLDHVNLLIDSGDDALARARAFYQELLGLEPLERPANTDSGNPGAWYQCGFQQLHLTTEKDASVVNRKSRRHPAFRVANLEALRHKLETAGIEIIAGNRFPGQERFFVRDPWGNRLEFVERTTG